MDFNIDRNQLLKLTKEELIDNIILPLIETVKQLQARVAELESQLSKPKKDSHNSSTPPSLDFKSSSEGSVKGGAKKGHKPAFRELQQPDREIFIKIEQCPHCGLNHNFTSQCYLKHQIIELKSLDFEIIDIYRQKSTCGVDKRSILAPNLDGVLDYDLFGPKLKSLVLILHYEHHLSYDKIRSFIQTFSPIKVSKSGILNVIRKCGKVFKEDYDEIMSHIKNQEVIGIDETGWRVCSQNEWLWAFQTDDAVLYKIEKSRGSDVVKDILGDSFSGTIISDFYSAYSKVQSKWKQKCLAHLLRKLQFIFELTGMNPQSYAGVLISLFKEAIHLNNSLDFGSQDFIRQRGLLERRLDQYLAEKVRHKEEQRIKKRLLKYRSELLLFLYKENVYPTNNLSEQAIRPKVVHRKICYGHRSHSGKESFAVNSTIMETIKKRKENLFEKINELLESKNIVKPGLQLGFTLYDTS